MSEYANYHCFRCNKDSKSNSYVPITPCGSEEVGVGGPGGGPVGGAPPQTHTLPGVFSWSFTINFSINTRIQIRKLFTGKTENVKGLSCGDGEIINLQEGSGTKYYCPPGYMGKGSKLVKRQLLRAAQVNMKNPAFESCLLSRQALLYVILLQRDVNISNFTTTFQLEMNTTNETFTKILQTYHTVLKRSLPVKTKLLNTLQNKLSISSSPIWLYAKHVFVTSLKKQILSNLYGFDISRTFSSDRLCAKPITYYGSRRAFSINCSTIINNVMVQASEFVSWIEFNKIASKQKISICLQYHLQSDCSLHLINSNYTIDSNKTVTYYGSNNKNLTVEGYFPLKNGIGTCLIQRNQTELLVSLHWLKTLAYFEYYISITGTSVSMICYISIIMTYTLFKKLRNIPGLNTLTLCCCLLIADVSFIVATQAHTVYHLCKVTGIMLHWSLLAAQMWMLVITFDIT